MSNSKRRHRRRWRHQSRAWKRALGPFVSRLFPEGLEPHRLVLGKNEIHWLGWNRLDCTVGYVVSRYPDVRAFLKEKLG